MGYSNKEGTLWSAQSLADDRDSTDDVIDVRNVSCGALVLVWSGATATDAVVKFQESMDGTSWVDISTITKTIGAAAGSHVFKLTRDILLCPLIKVVIVDNTESTGTASLKYFFKGDR